MDPVATRVCRTPRVSARDGKILTIMCHNQANLSSEKSVYWESFRPSVKRILARKGLRHIALARACSVSASTMSSWVNKASKPGAKQKYPSADQLFKMADFLEVSLDKLMGRKCPGSEVLEEDRRAAQKRANALDQMLAAESADEWGGAPDPKKKPKRKKP